MRGDLTTLLILLALVGTTLIVVRGTICKPIRYFELFRCAQCAGFWIGAAAGVSGVVQTGRGWILDAFIVGAATSFLSMLADAVLLHLLGDPEKS